MNFQIFPLWLQIPWFWKNPSPKSDFFFGQIFWCPFNHMLLLVEICLLPRICYNVPELCCIKRIVKTQLLKCFSYSNKNKSSVRKDEFGLHSAGVCIVNILAIKKLNSIYIYNNWQAWKKASWISLIYYHLAKIFRICCAYVQDTIRDFVFIVNPFER